MPFTLIRGLHNLRAQHRGCVATIGSFDGVHRGHRAIIDQLLAQAQALGLPSVVMVFEPQPYEFFSGEKAPARLMRLRDKVRVLSACGVDRVFCLQFNQRLRQLSADDFIKQVLVQGLGIKSLVVGDDFRFGCDRAGDFQLLQRAGLEYGFSVFDTCTVQDGLELSSTAHAAAHFKQCRERRSEWNFVVTWTINVTRHRKQLSTTVIRLAQIQELFSAHFQNKRDGGESLGIVDCRRLAVQTK